MLIKEVCQLCALTKKAVEYYEERGLLQPVILENGYRDYNEEEIATLKEISVLRRCGVGISQIKEILKSSNRSSALAKYRYVAQVQMQRLIAVQKCMDELIEDYDIDREFDYLSAHNEDMYTIKEQLVFSFPGNYGLFLALHFGRFLNESIDTQEKRNAYAAIIKYLESVDLYLSADLSDFLSATISALEENGDLAQVQLQISNDMMKAMEDTEKYIEENQEGIKDYLDFKMSDEFKQSPAGQFQQSILEFQRASGYQEIFIANMKILSKSYCEYSQQLAIANEKFVQKFPISKDIYE